MQLKNSLMNNPLVSICCVTYNHENFIRQCLDGFVMQQTTFEYEILVHEDASTDSTAKILREYEAKYPHLFRCVYQTVNQFKIQNTLTNILFPMARGKYIALCEGDDYWTDPLKLQKQVDFLEKNKDIVICGHGARILDTIRNTEFLEVNRERYIYFEDMIKKNWFFTSSVVFRNIIKKFPINFHKLPQGDWPLYLLLLEKGAGYFMNENMSVYRCHEKGVWSTLDEIEAHKKIIFTYRKFLGIFDKHSSEIKYFTVKYKLKYHLFFKELSIYIFYDIIELYKMGIKKLLK